MRVLMRDWTPGPYERLWHRELFGHHLLADDLRLGLYLGHLRPSYPGTDALSLSVSPQVELWLQQGLNPHLEWIFGEGQRLGTSKFLPILAQHVSLTVIHLVLDEASAAARRDARIIAGDTKRWHGLEKPVSEQSIRARFSMVEKAARTCDEAGVPVVRLDARQSPESIAAVISELVALDC